MARNGATSRTAPGGVDSGPGERLRTASVEVLAEARRQVDAPEGDDATAVHEFRKAMKRWRAILRLYEPLFGEEAVRLRVEATDSAFTAGYSVGQIINTPVAHADGNFFADIATLGLIEDNNRVAFRYAEGTNPNGSMNDIAGIFNRERNVLGLMPHPENLIESAHGGIAGALVGRTRPCRQAAG